jgi:hypothetical protein
VTIVVSNLPVAGTPPSVSFGDSPVSNVRVVSDSAIFAETPAAKAPEQVDVTVRTASGTAASGKLTFTYV